jgi:hypothetical protein
MNVFQAEMERLRKTILNDQLRNEVLAQLQEPVRAAYVCEEPQSADSAKPLSRTGISSC